MDFIRQKYKVAYAPNTRETVRRQVLHQFVLAGVADYNPFAPNLPTNSPRAHYAVSEAALDAIGSFGSPRWETAVAKFLSGRTALIEIFERRRSKLLIPVRFPDGKLVKLSPALQRRTFTFMPKRWKHFISRSQRTTSCRMFDRLRREAQLGFPDRSGDLSRTYVAKARSRT
jgi:hypothetical protein